MKDYSMYRYYKGEDNSPFDKEKQNTEYMFWLYEASFEKDFSERDSSDWHSFFDGFGMGDAFMNILSNADYEKPTGEKKKQIFDLWLEYLFSVKLYGEYDADNWYQNAYLTVAQ